MLRVQLRLLSRLCFFLSRTGQVEICHNIEDFKTELTTLFFVKSGGLAKFANHMKVLDEEIFVERKNYFTYSHFIQHHKCNQILFLICSVVYHVHVD